jgi:hypothetical protein
MSQDTQYAPIPYVYIDKGLIARDQTDECPPYTYIQSMNTLARAENSLSSRYGTIIVNRDAVGSGTSNHFFTSPVTSLSRLNYQSNAWRYAGLANGTLQRRTGSTQGAFTQLALPKTWYGAQIALSGNAFDSVIDNCFETSQAYLFIADAAASIKDSGSGNPQLWGIDPSPYTLNVNPYAPLLIMIDSFAEANTYSVVNVSGWAWGNIETLDANSGQLITDFSQFYGIGPSGGGTTNYSPTPTSLTVSATQTGAGENIQNSSVAGSFASVVPAYGDTVSLTVVWNGSVSATSGTFATGAVNIQYSPDGGTSWFNMAGTSANSTTTFPTITSNISLTVSNLDLIQVRAQAIAVIGSGGATVTATTNITNIYASISNPAAFGPVMNGMLALLNTNTTVNIPISSVTSSGLVSDLYQTLTVMTTAAHGLSVGALIAIYASSSDLVDGFYQIVSVPSSTTFTVYFCPNGANGDTSPPVTLSGSATQIGATGGYVTGGATAPYACVLTDQYSSPYPSQMSAWGFYEWVPPTTTAFPISAWAGNVAASTSGTVSKTVTLDLNQNNQVTDGDLIVLTLLTSNPNNIAQITLQFWVGASSLGTPTNYYQANISPAYYQSSLNGSVLAYEATQSQILADTLNLITGQPPGTTSAQLQPTNIGTGSGSWAACLIPRGNFLPVGQAGQAGLDWSNITGWTLTVTTNSNAGGVSFSTNGLYLQWGYGPSSFAGVGYDYRQTYYDANTGTESSPCPIQQFNTDYGYLSSTAAPIFLRQAAQVVGQYSTNPQITHVRIYRRGGTLSSNWVQVIQAPNVTTGGTFVLKEVIADEFVEQAQILVLDNDPPVTSSLLNPIQTQLSAATASPGSSIYSTFSPQMVAVAQAGAVFVPGQIVIVGNANNLEEVAVTMGGIGSFSAVLRLEHNMGEPVNVYAAPRQPCNLCAVAYGQVWLAGDPNNPHYLYYSKKGLPENFGPQNYIPVSTPDDPINAVINWRGTLIVGTLKSWFIIVGGASPYAQPTGSVHGIVAQQGWIEVEGAIWYQAADGIREFTGADGVYKTLPVEWIFRGNPQCLPPQANQTDFPQSILAYYNNIVYCSYVSTLNSGQRYRLNWDTQYNRFRNDDVPATAMLWEKDINTLLVGKQIGVGQYAVVQDQIGDYDDGGWVAGALVQTPINLTIQHPYRDLGKPHQFKQFNALETDVNTQNQTLNTTLLFEDGSISIVLPGQNTGTTRQKCEMIVTGAGQPEGGGQQAYRASILHTIAVTTAITLYQEEIAAAILPELSTSYDTYAQKFGTDLSKFIKQLYLDYTSPVALNCSVYADGSVTPYWTFTLPAQSTRGVIRVRMSNLSSGTTAFTMRTWRLIIIAASTTNPLQGFLLWQNPRVEWKPVGSNSYQIKELEV